MDGENAALGVYTSAWLAHALQSCGPNSDRFIGLQRDLDFALCNYREWQLRQNQTQAYTQPISDNAVSTLYDLGGEGPATLVVPSLINGHEILDLENDCSLVRYLVSQKRRVYLLTWKNPNAGDQAFSKSYISAIQDAANAIPSAQLSAIGYCIGGTLLNLAAPQIRGLHNLTFLGAPWNFHHDAMQIGQWANNLKNGVSSESFFDQLETIYGCFPSLFLDYFFATLNPLQFVEKFKSKPKDQKRFDLIEHWLTNGRNLSLAFAKELFIDWMGANQLAQSQFKHDIPTLILTGQRDHIAPAESCLPITRTTSQSRHISHPSGHVGLLIGRESREKLWPEIAKHTNTHLTQQNFA